MIFFTLNTGPTAQERHEHESRKTRRAPQDWAKIKRSMGQGWPSCACYPAYASCRRTRGAARPACAFLFTTAALDHEGRKAAAHRGPRPLPMPAFERACRRRVPAPRGADRRANGRPGEQVHRVRVLRRACIDLPVARSALAKHIGLCGLGEGVIPARGCMVADR